MIEHALPADRLEELLVERALFGLGDEDRRELDRMSDASSDRFGEELEAAAAAVALATGEHEPMPEHLRHTVLSQSPATGSASTTHAERLE